MIEILANATLFLFLGTWFFVYVGSGVIVVADFIDAWKCRPIRKSQAFLWHLVSLTILTLYFNVLA